MRFFEAGILLLQILLTVVLSKAESCQHPQNLGSILSEVQSHNLTNSGLVKDIQSINITIEASNIKHPHTPEKPHWTVTKMEHYLEKLLIKVKSTNGTFKAYLRYTMKPKTCMAVQVQFLLW